MAIAQPQASLPRAIRCYFEAVAADSAEAVAACFAVDGVVFDALHNATQQRRPTRIRVALTRIR